MTTTTFTDGVTPVVADWLNDVDAHTYDQVSAAHTATSIAFTPAGSIVATTVQAALSELDGEKQPLDAELTALAGLTSAANKVPMFSGVGTATTIDFLDEDTMVSDSATAVPSQQSVKAYFDSLGATSGTYSPTVTSSTNVDGASGANFTYIKVGNVVHLSGVLTIDPTSASTSTELYFTLPVASNFTNANNLQGFILSSDISTYGGGIIIADTVDDRARVIFTSGTSVTSILFRVSAQYIVI